MGWGRGTGGRAGRARRGGGGGGSNSEDDDGEGDLCAAVPVSRAAREAQEAALAHDIANLEVGSCARAPQLCSHSDIVPNMVPRRLLDSRHNTGAVPRTIDIAVHQPVDCLNSMSGSQPQYTVLPSK